MYTETLTKAIPALNTQSDLQMMLATSSSVKQIDNPLIKYQGQKWNHLFDFEKALKQIRIAEKQLLRGGPVKSESSSSSAKSQGEFLVPPAPPPPPTPSVHPCAHHLRQVSRLPKHDMRFYGIALKQSTMDLIICDSCQGVYTKMGFNNHTMVHHPSVWSTVTTKVAMGLCKQSQVAARDISSDTGPSTSAAAGVQPAAKHAGSTRHKSSKAGSSGKGRSRSKAKHQSSASVHQSAVSPTKKEKSSKSSKKSSKKAAAAPPPPPPPPPTPPPPIAIIPVVMSTPVKDMPITSGKPLELLQPITVFSSSSNSPCSLPPTPKMLSTINIDTPTVSGTQDSVFSPASLIPFTDQKDNLTADAPVIPSIAKKKVKISAFLAQESVDSSNSSSSIDFDRPSTSAAALAALSKSKSKSVKSANFSPHSRANKHSVSSSVGGKPSIGSNFKHFDPQISELDQAVSSIIGSQHNKMEIQNPVCMEAANTAGYKLQPITPMRRDKIPPGIAPAPPQLTSNYVPQEVAPVCAEQMVPNTADDNSILTLEDMLDSKFINEILSTAESEMHFDENELDSTSQQNYMQQSSGKRIRYEEQPMIQQQPPEMSEEAYLYQQQQHQQQQQQQHQQQQQQLLQEQQKQFQHYNAINLENIKIYNEPQAVIAPQYQVAPEQQLPQQIATIDPMQLQQYLYQQQNLIAYGGNIEGTETLQQQQFDPTGIVNPKEIIGMCTEEDLQKPKTIDVNQLEGKLPDYASLTAINNEYMDDGQFEIFNIPSLSDELAEDIVLPTMVDSERSGQQYVLPSTEEQIIYEITANNQVAVMSQQRQQQVIAEFLTQAGYQNVANINTVPAATTSAATNEMWNDSNEFQDFDYSLVETTNPLATAPASARKVQEDCYFNVYQYAAMPRPLSINSYGLMKLAQGGSTTFRKNLLTMRKANNNPFTLSGAVSSNTATATRFANTFPKPAQNYFTALTAGSGSLANEFSIGTITVTNSPTMSQQQLYTQQKQQCMGAPMDMSFHSPACGPTLLPMTALQKGRQKASTIVSAGGTFRTPSRQTTHTQSPKTIHVSSTVSAAERVKLTKRACNMRVDATKKPHFSTKQIADILSGKESPKHQPHNQHQGIDHHSQDGDKTDEQLKMLRIKKFYERRRKLFHMTSGSRQRQHYKQKTLKQQPLRYFSECGINAHCKSNNPINDNMRVLV